MPRETIGKKEKKPRAKRITTKQLKTEIDTIKSVQNSQNELLHALTTEIIELQWTKSDLKITEKEDPELTKKRARDILSEDILQDNVRLPQVKGFPKSLPPTRANAGSSTYVDRKYRGIIYYLFTDEKGRIFIDQVRVEVEDKDTLEIHEIILHPKFNKRFAKRLKKQYEWNVDIHITDKEKV